MNFSSLHRRQSADIKLYSIFGLNFLEKNHTTTRGGMLSLFHAVPVHSMLTTPESSFSSFDLWKGGQFLEGITDKSKGVGKSAKFRLMGFV